MPNLKEVLLGRLAVTRKLLSPAELARVLEEQGKRPDKPPLGALLIQLGLLTQQQVEELVAAQVAAFSAQHDSAPGTQGEHSFGRKVVEAGLLPQEQVNECIRQQGILEGQGRFVRLGEIMVQSGLLSAEQVQQLLGAQGKRVVKCASCGAQYNVAIQAEAAAMTCPRCKRPIQAKPPVAVAMPPIILPSVHAEGTFYRDPGATLVETVPAPAPVRAAAQPSPQPPPARPSAGRHPTRTTKVFAAPQAKYVSYRSRRVLMTGLPLWAPLIVVGATGLFVALNFLGKGERPKTPVQASEEGTRKEAGTGAGTAAEEQEAQWARALASLPTDDPVEAVLRLEALEGGPLATRAHPERMRRERALEDELTRKFDACRRRAEEAASKGDWDGVITAWIDFPSELDIHGRFRKEVGLARKYARARRAEAEAHKGAASSPPATPPPSTPATPPSETQPSPQDKQAQDLIEEANKYYDESYDHHEKYRNAPASDTATRRREIAAAFDAVSWAKEKYQKAQGLLKEGSNDWLDQRVEECLQRYKVLKYAKEAT